jgi:hypothetical protein
MRQAAKGKGSVHRQKDGGKVSHGPRHSAGLRKKKFLKKRYEAQGDPHFAGLFFACEKISEIIFSQMKNEGKQVFHL